MTLKLLALDGEDLEVVSAHMQDAVFKVGDLQYWPSHKQFAIAANRFVWEKADGALKAYVETVNVEITDGKLTITFLPQTQNPQINGIEIIPAD